MGRTQRVGHGVVDVSEGRGVVAPGEAAGHVAAADKALQLGGRAVSRLGGGVGEKPNGVILAPPAMSSANSRAGTAAPPAI